ncbi:protein KIAA0100-like isoform X1 [Anopheles albimanus]|uniref:protein KIAA0100-like isoform X1 n=1 Tax=Anopheles albimanus TaxID=7167 RepID=UPI0016422187|nr:protein KIAA0100-like isoform X1 [Anopheles albimanus]
MVLQILYVLVLSGLIYLALAWILPKVIGYGLRKLYKIEINVGRFAFPLSLRDVTVCKSGYSVQIDEISLQSSFVNSDVSKLLSINVRDLRINKDIKKSPPVTSGSGTTSSGGPSSPTKGTPRTPPSNYGQSYDTASPTAATNGLAGEQKILDFREKKVSPRILKFAQFMAIHINNIAVALMNSAQDPGWWLHATAKELHLDGSLVHSTKSLLVSASLCDAQAKILPKRPESSRKATDQSQSCLGELSFGIALDGALIVDGPMSLEKLTFAMTTTKVILHGGLYEFIKDVQAQKHRQRARANSLKQPGASTEHGAGPGAGSLSSLPFNEVYERIAPIIPKLFSLKIENTTISAVRENTSNDFSASLQTFAVSGKFSPNRGATMEDNPLPLVYVGLQLQQLEIDTRQEKLLYLQQFNIDSKLENNLLNVYSKLSSFVLIYNHREIYGWINANFLSSESPAAGVCKSLNPKSHKPSAVGAGGGHGHGRSRRASFLGRQSASGSGLLDQLLTRIIVKGCAELWDLTTMFKFGPGQVSSICCAHTKLLLDQTTERRSKVYHSRLLNLLLDRRHWSAELLIESVWWSLGSNLSHKESAQSLKKSHIRGSPFFIAMSLNKLSSYGDTTKLDFSVHTFRLEYSPGLAEYLVHAKRCLEQYRTQQQVQHTSHVKPLTTSSSHRGGHSASSLAFMRDLLVTARVTDVSGFLFNQYETCVLANLNELTVGKSTSKNFVRLDGFQMEILDFRHISGCDYGSAELQNVFANVKGVRVELMEEKDSSKIELRLLEHTVIMWNANLHMHLVTLLKEMQQLRADLKTKPIPEPPLELPQTAPQATASASTSSDGVTGAAKSFLRSLPFIVYTDSSVEIGIKISDRHSMQVFVENAYALRNEQWMLSIENIAIKIDDQHIFTVKGVYVESVDRVDLLCQERQNYEQFKLASNRAWLTSIGGVKAIFPYEHDFYGAIVNEFVSIYKWLKVVHNYKKKPFTVDLPLPSDMIIQIKEFLLEMSDDPFEVKLRENYVLLLDEYHESVKRKELFDQKIEQLCAERLMLPPGMLEELNANLIKKNSEIYIQRSKKISETGPPRTRLIAWVMTDLEIMAMADPSLHGAENAIRTIRMLDPDSPWPDEGIEFVTLWCRAVDISCSEWMFLLRDYPQPMFHVKAMHLFGTLAGAEMAPPRRAKRDVEIEIGEPFGTHTVQRSMTSIKFYHDFNWDLDYLAYAFGPCWEPVMAQCNLMMEKISAPSRDPSPPLPFWDKMRLLMHGQLSILAKQFTILLHASLDPYNTTEEMELTWSNCGIMYSNARLMFKGDLNIYVRTASQYDDCRVLHLPNLKLTFKLNWVCLANPNDHHSVIPCAPDKLPEYSSNQVHDSFRAFRSQHLNIWVSFEIKQPTSEMDIPNLVLYGSTLRWFESLKLILSGVTRPTRRGPVFNNVRPRKKQLSRHYRKANLQMSLQRFQIFYWMSHALNRGFQLSGGRITLSSEHTLTLQPIDDGLIHRPRADWSVMYMNCELNDSEIWLRTTLSTNGEGDQRADRSNSESSENISTASGDIYRYYFLSVAKVSYGREALLSTNGNEREKDTPTHKLVVYDLKGAWTKDNRDVAFALFDSLVKSQKLKNNLSTEALKCFRKEGSAASGGPVGAGGPGGGAGGAGGGTPLKARTGGQDLHSGAGAGSSAGGGAAGAGRAVGKSQQSSDSLAMLQQLIQEAEHKPLVYSDDQSAQTRQQQLKGLQAYQEGDVMHYNWAISLVNSQVLLKGCETSGYVILSAAKAEILQRVHRPVWRDHTIVSKTTWVGSLECMQYYATVSANEGDAHEMAEIMWLKVDNIQEKDREVTVISELPDLPHLVGSGQSVGGVVSETVGVLGESSYSKGQKPPIQLQRIVSRCKCEFFYVCYGDTSIDPGTISEVPPLPVEETLVPWESQDEPVDAFTLMHHDLDVCTNSLQYAMILDIVNNLLLYVEPQRKEALEQLARMRFQLQLYSSEDQKRPIQHMQTEIRSLMSRIRCLEKDIHFITKARLEEGDTEELRVEYEDVHNRILNYKELLTTKSDELDMMLSCYNEAQLSASNRMATFRKDKPVTIVRANEICFKHAQWRLTEADGQIGIADLILSSFLYTKNSKSDDSVDHLLELGYIRINNLIPRDYYTEVLCPTEIQRYMPVDHKRVLRVFCREKPPVGGISVKEHFEINVVPITIQISKKFYNTMLKFCFPDRDESETVDDLEDGAASISSSGTGGGTSGGSVGAGVSGGPSTGKKQNNSSAASIASTAGGNSTTSVASSSGAGGSKSSSGGKKASKDSNFYVRIQDDVEKMKERAEKNKLFIYIKIPEVPVRVSYKGNKEKNFEDITDLSLLIPTLEYHNVTWTWLDLLLAMKSDSRRVLLSQAIKQKLKLKKALVDEQPTPQEEDKAKMLFGNRHAVSGSTRARNKPENKSLRKGVFKFSKS